VDDDDLIQTALQYLLQKGVLQVQARVDTTNMSMELVGPHDTIEMRFEGGQATYVIPGPLGRDQDVTAMVEQWMDVHSFRTMQVAPEWERKVPPGRVFFMAQCEKCTAQIPFGDRAERDTWASRHAKVQDTMTGGLHVVKSWTEWRA
jgi:hypothetical protein